jgi:hypothetical protein
MAFHATRARRVTSGPMASDDTFGNNGVFVMESPEPGWQLFFIASDGLGWEHVSVRAQNGRKSRVPNWKEMCAAKDLCWDEEDVVVQFHPRKSEYVNNHPHVLHLWRPTQETIPTPHSLMVGDKSRGEMAVPA